MEALEEVFCSGSAEALERTEDFRRYDSDVASLGAHHCKHDNVMADVVYFLTRVACPSTIFPSKTKVKRCSVYPVYYNFFSVRSWCLVLFLKGRVLADGTTTPGLLLLHPHPFFSLTGRVFVGATPLQDASPGGSSDDDEVLLSGRFSV